MLEEDTVLLDFACRESKSTPICAMVNPRYLSLVGGRVCCMASLFLHVLTGGRSSGYAGQLFGKEYNFTHVHDVHLGSSLET